MDFIELFGKQIPIRTHYCKFFDSKPAPLKEQYLNIYVRAKGCNAKCEFCEYYDDASNFNYEKYLYILKEIKDKILIKKFAFTGGEPTLNYNQFRETIKLTRKHYPDTTFVLNSNGLNLTKLKDDTETYNEINSISLSRHHYSDEINNKILGFKSISKDDIKIIQENSKNKTLINVSCNLIKGYIDSKEEVYKYLEFASTVGIRYVGLVSLMPINDYCKDNLIDFNSLDLVTNRFSLTKTWSYENVCRCNNYIYIPENSKVMKVYYKNTYNPDNSNVNLVFDGENLTNGFSGDIII